VLIAWDGNTAVGCAGLKRYNAADAEIKRVWVEPPYRNRHIAREMMIRLEQKALEGGYSRTILQTREIMEFDFMDQERREAFYRRLGLKMSAPEVYEEFWKAGDFFVRGFEHCWEFSWEPMSPGETVSYGDYTFELVPLPGHTRGQMGLLDREKKLIFSGDQLLNGVASIVRDSGNYPDALEDYFTSMRAVKHDYSDCLFIPGHGVPFRDPGADIDKVVGNYTEKFRIIHDCLKNSEKPLCVWGVFRRAYGQFGKEISPAMRQQFILIWMKTYACLAFLERRGLVVSKENEDGVPLWSPAV
jgi:N-acetylglutamate synthase-like GNAT family acetyltransferase